MNKKEESSIMHSLSQISDSESLMIKETSTIYEKKEDFRRLFNSIIIPTCFIVSMGFHLFFLYPMIEKKLFDKNTFFLSKIIFYSLNAVWLWFLVDLILTIFTQFIKKRRDNNSFLIIVLNRKNRIIKIVITLFILSFFIQFYEAMVMNRIVDKIKPSLSTSGPSNPVEKTKIENEKEEIKVTNTTIKEFIINNFANLMLGISVFMFVLLLKSLVLESIDHLMYWSSYFQKILKDNNDVKCLYLLNSVTDKKPCMRTEAWIRHVFKKISPKGDPITRSSLDYFLGQYDVDLIFKTFNKENDQITEEEFIYKWKSIVKSKKEFKSVIRNKNVLLTKLDYVLFTLFIPLAIFLSLAILGGASKFRDIMSIALGGLLPLSFIFSNVLGDLFNSLIFVFLVRPFEIGDIIELDHRRYKVEDIGLLYTNFLNSSLVISIQNTQLMSKHISNLRISQIFEKKYVLEFEIEQFKKKLKELKESIRNELNLSKFIFTGKFKIHNYEINPNDRISVTIVVYANLHAPDLSGEIDKFSIKLNFILNKLGLIKSDKVAIAEEKEASIQAL